MTIERDGFVMCPACNQMEASARSVSTCHPPNDEKVSLTLKCRACSYEWTEMRGSIGLRALNKRLPDKLS